MTRATIVITLFLAVLYSFWPVIRTLINLGGN
jgi:hypothetical protein